ncbi:LLM class F420-dependent oxidoreductase [Actinosynnema sp. NPDC020468]|uniref:LLM class F420-dependent oxidoreductase n=1 Tax=Actinosynnema sp. NPDC020468 TaxID=3154488 RepID=UPI0033C9EF63
MRFGLIPPVVLRGADAWEDSAGVEELTRIAEAADSLGYHHITCSEHVGVPTAVAEVRGGRYWDPLATLAFLAARTTSLRLLTNVLVLGYHHPLAVAKSYGTLDRLSGGRVLLGVGVGSLEEEFALLGEPFEDRGPRADDALRALRAAWGRPAPSYSGPHYAFEDFLVDPHAVRTHVPLWVGGRTRRSLRRAVDLGDGWMPFGLTPSRVRAEVNRFDVRPGFEVVLQSDFLDPIGAPDRTLSQVDDLDAVCTTLNVRLTARDVGHHLEQLHALTELWPGGVAR